MTLEEAIIHAEEVAEKNEKSAEYMKNKYGEHVAGYGIHCKCAKEHRQLAEWLKELKERREKDVPDTNVGDMISRQAAIDCVSYDVQDTVERIEALPSAQPERCEDKLKEIADALSEKMCYMNTCPNERDIILGYLGRKCSSKNHCNTDCWNEKCESYHYETKQQSEPCEDAVSREAIMKRYNEGELSHVHHVSRNNLLDYIESLPSVTPKPQIGELVVEECEDAVSRQRLLNDLKELIAAWEKYPVMAEQIKGVEVAIGYVELIPSVTPKRKPGKWVYKPNEYDDSMYECSQYGQPWTLIDGTPEENNMKFCPNCGVKMNGGEHDDT